MQGFTLPSLAVIASTLIVPLLLAGTASAETLRVAAAISLKGALTEIAVSYKAKTGGDVKLVFGSSGQLATQIKSGAEVDVFISAALKQVDDLAREGLVDAKTRRTVASNTLVLVVPADAKDAPGSFEALGSTTGKIAIGEPKTVPAGQYAEQVFKALKLTDRLAGRLVLGTNVRQVLTYVERGEVAAGVVYATDALEAGSKVRVVATADAKTHDPIVYPAVVVSATTKAPAAAKFVTYLGGEDASKVLRAKGFVVPTHGEGGGGAKNGDTKSGSAAK